MNVADALSFASLQFDSAVSNDGSNSDAVADFETDAKYLVSHVLKKNFTWLKTWQDYELSNQQITLLTKLVTRRKLGEPIAYITGEKDFWTLTLKTNASTLIPRPETELLVEEALNFLENTAKAKVLDLGTGTGAIALAIASERLSDDVTASDFQEGAVTLAKENTELNRLKNVTVLQSDWFKSIKENQFDLIVSNPPYIEENDPHIQQGDLVFEPNSALVAKDQGLSDIKIIIEQAKNYLKNSGSLMIEHGFEQGEILRELFDACGYSQINTIKDLNGLERITLGVK